MTSPIVFLDRDGVINVDSEDYIKTPDEFEFIPQSPEAVALLHDHGFRVIIITNQSVIGRGMVSPMVLQSVFDKMTAGINAAGGQVTDIFFCPHHPDDQCDCRKPGPGMILEAARKYGADPGRTIMAGDSEKDILCGKTAGCGSTVLVLTGNGETARSALAERDIFPDAVCKNLYAAAEWIVQNR